MKRFGVGVIGAGFIGKAHATAYNNVTNIFGAEIQPELIVVSDVNEEAARKLCESHRFKRYTTDWREVVQAGDVDVITVATPNNTHCEISIEAARNGKHVNCEKPLGMNAAEARRAVDEIRKCGVTGVVGFNMIKNPVQAYVKELIDSGALGELVSFRGTYDTDGLADKRAPYQWRMKKEASSAGALGDLATHVLSLSQYLLGDIDAVCGMTEIVHSQRSVPGDPGKMLQVENDDISQFMFKYKSGAMGMIVSSRVACGRKQSLTYEIQCTEGTVLFDLERQNEIRIYHQGENSREQGFKTVLIAPGHGEYANFFGGAGIGLGYEDMKIIETYHFLKCAADKEPPAADFEFGARITEIVDAVLESADSGSWVTV